MQKEEMTAGQFAEKIGLSPSSLSHILNGRNNPSLDVVMKIHKACSYVNLPWLIYGEGEMEGQPEVFNSGEAGISGCLCSTRVRFYARGDGRTRKS